MKKNKSKNSIFYIF
jgi:hypothetical protein